MATLSYRTHTSIRSSLIRSEKMRVIEFVVYATSVSGRPPALPGRQYQFDVLGSPPTDFQREQPRHERNSADGRV